MKALIPALQAALDNPVCYGPFEPDWDVLIPPIQNTHRAQKDTIVGEWVLQRVIKRIELAWSKEFCVFNCKNIGGWLGLLLVLTVLCAAPSAAQDTVPAAQALLEQFDELYRSTGTAARIEIKIERPKKVRTMQMRSWSQGEDKALVVIDAPARDAGTATLRVGSNLWNYLPKISRTIRVPPALMMGAWMGSDLTNDDLVRESSYAHDYEITGVGPSEEPPGWQVSTEAKPGVPGLWERIEVVFAPPKLATDSTQAEQLPILVRYYDRKGRLSRTMQLEEIKKMGGRLIPTRIAISPEREASTRAQPREGRRTVLTYLHVEFDVELDESLFSLAQLERRR